LSFPHVLSGNPECGSPTRFREERQVLPESALRIGASVKTQAALPQCCFAAFGDNFL